MKQSRILRAAFALPMVLLAAASHGAAPTVLPAPDPAAKAILDASREAAAKVQTFSYEAVALGDGALADQTPRHAATVTATRADAGGWKLLAKGAIAPIKASAAAPPASEYHVGYDGASVWSLREKEKSVIERSATKTAELERFYRAQGAWPVVAWDLLTETPFDVEAADIQRDGEGTASGVACDIIRVGKADDEDAKGAASYVRYFISKKDKLPRRIERVREAAPDAKTDSKDDSKADVNPEKDAKKEKSIRLLELKDLKIDSAVSQVAYSISVPEGFKVRADKSDRPETANGTPKDKSGPKVENPLLRGPGVADKGEKKDEGDAAPGEHKSDPNLLAVGSAAPAWTLKDPDGKEYSLADFKGKVVVMDFWGTWCGWCVKAMPQIQAVHEKYKDKQVVVLGINNEHSDRADPKKFMADKKFTYGLLLKAETIAPKYKVRGWPTLYIIDPEGKIAFAESGYSPQLEQILSEQIEKAMAKGKK